LINTKKSKARFSRPLMTSGLETERAYFYFGISQISTYLFTYTLTHLFTAEGPTCGRKRQHSLNSVTYIIFVPHK